VLGERGDVSTDVGIDEVVECIGFVFVARPLGTKEEIQRLCATCVCGDRAGALSKGWCR